MLSEKHYFKLRNTCVMQVCTKNNLLFDHKLAKQKASSQKPSLQ